MTMTRCGAVRGIDKVPAPGETTDRHGAAPLGTGLFFLRQALLARPGRFAKEVPADLERCNRPAPRERNETVAKRTGESRAKLVIAAGREAFDRAGADVQVARCESDEHGSCNHLSDVLPSQVWVNE